jgi:integrase
MASCGFLWLPIGFLNIAATKSPGRNMPTLKLTKRVVETLRPRPRGDFFAWDESLPGFGVRVQAGGRKVYVIGYRPQGARRFRRLTLGRHGPLTLDQARRLAKQHLGAVAAGADPVSARQTARQAATVARLGAEYLAHLAAVRSPAHAAKSRRMWERHVVRAFGSRTVASITLADVSKLHRSLRDTPILANRVAALLSGFFTYASRQGVRPRHENPVQGLERYAEHAKERFLGEAEWLALGEVLRRAELTGLPPAEEHRRETPVDPERAKHVPHSANIPIPADRFAVAALRLLALTGARVSEVLTLEWVHVDLEAGFLRLPKTKSGASIRALGGAARELLASVPRVAGNPYCFPGRRCGGHLTEVKRLWYAVRTAAKLQDVRLHDLRHSHASMAIGAGHSLPVIAKLLGHRRIGTSERYAHLADHPLRRAADATANSIAVAMGDRTATPVTPIGKRKRQRA